MFCTHRVHFTYFGILLRVAYDLSVCDPVILFFFESISVRLRYRTVTLYYANVSAMLSLENFLLDLMSLALSLE